MASGLGGKTRRFLDQTEHQQNEPTHADALHERQEYGGQAGDPNRQTPNTGAGGPRLLVGPLLNYRRMSRETTDGPMWHGSVLTVMTPGHQVPALHIRNADGGDQSPTRTIQGERLYEDPKSCFWRFLIDVPFLPKESRWEYYIPDMQYADPKKQSPLGPKIFVIPSKYASMRILFHSCNGFSVGTDEDAWNGPALWQDVLRNHEQQPFHVMIGGGDQIYNDGVRVDGPLRPWTDIASPVKRRNFPFDEELRAKCDQYYFDNYVRWYGTETFSFANCIIPQLNIWDDHDIIDGFGSYTDHFMQCAVFRGIGGVAYKYYLLFQHHLPPPQSTFTTDAPQTMHANENGMSGADSVQLKDTFVLTTDPDDPSYIIGEKPGPYVEERSRSIYCQLGARIAFVGLDARTERTRHQINYPETYNQVFSRVSRELESNPNIKHLVLLLGVPIAYPRLQWLENIFQSPIIGPIRFLNKRFGVAGGFFNHFDGQVDLLDDLDDHYTARQHKTERRELIHRLQAIAEKYNVRVSILGGDVHLAALGRFYSNPSLGIPIEKDWRYMTNIISSAITNKPPPSAVANVLARRNKIHHLDPQTDETLLNIFNRDPGKGQPGVSSKTSDKNHCTMPSRNYAIIRESHDLADEATFQQATNADSSVANEPPSGVLNPLPPPPPTANGSAHSNRSAHTTGHLTDGTANSSSSRPSSGAATTHGGGGTATTTTTNNNSSGSGSGSSKNPRNALHVGEENAGTNHPAASGLERTGLGGHYGLDVTFRIEISPSDPAGRTDGYGFTIPGLSSSSSGGGIAAPLAQAAPGSRESLT